MTEQHPPQPNRILAEPATVKACAADLGTDPAAARDQLALARAHGAEQAGVPRSHG
ncbi:hypothetical protein C9F11_37460 [Streptomyces sp. YIM 121038]|uniref:hypothetical protein n=1 Tax=Streptomyces sp. YIM 121038 TaxID=2136401 RepID=UPI001162C816|nr:hypothetical protein [Streptomyces sp. YIM 121038]QCX81075.1 hypothetical protein C9F11_37460 [Streptomyces sp. YIM 121038]